MLRLVWKELITSLDTKREALKESTSMILSFRWEIFNSMIVCSNGKMKKSRITSKKVRNSNLSKDNNKRKNSRRRRRKKQMIRIKKRVKSLRTQEKMRRKQRRRRKKSIKRKAVRKA